jgi:hypothetical protein
MDSQRHNKTHKKIVNEGENQIIEQDDTFKTLLEDSAREAYSRPWHRIERGLRLNRLRIFVEEIGPQFEMTSAERVDFFIFLQKALDKKLLNTLKVVNYDQEKQRIMQIRGLDIKRNPEGLLKWGFSSKKPRTDGTRKKRKDEISIISLETKIENAESQ